MYPKPSGSQMPPEFLSLMYTQFTSVLGCLWITLGLHSESPLLAKHRQHSSLAQLGSALHQGQLAVTWVT